MKAEKAVNQAVASIVVPAEWAPQQAIWTAWPSHGDLWLENLEPARKEVAAMIMALASEGPVNVLAMGDEAQAAAKAALPSPNVKIIAAKFGDIWLRDTGPIFVLKDGKKAAATFGFNGWGGKYDLPHDDEVAAFVAEKSGVPAVKHDFILEGGSLEHDGAGAILTTRECLLNDNRQPGGGEAVVEKKLKDAFGAKKIYWLNNGLMNDHTDGHVDNLARFVAPGHALCQTASGEDDPNTELFETVAADLAKMGLKVTQIPSPGLILNEDDEPVAASHMNYIIYNNVIVLPTYEEVHSKAAAAALAKLFPKHRIVPLPARHVLTGGGSFHCITQQEF
jgi:agmatine deiminase